jgi:ribosomal protein S18 acetylase RimI-like enzyme
VEVRRATTSQEVLAAGGLFDGNPDGEATARFLDTPGHHLLLAYDGETPVGFATGVEMTHPDKGTELFLYELGVADAARGRGVGTGLVDAMRRLAAERGCYGMWTLTEPENDAARATYRTAGASEEEETVLFGWPIG